MIGEIGDAEQKTLCRIDCGPKTRDTLLVVEPGHARGLCADHRACGHN